MMGQLSALSVLTVAAAESAIGSAIPVITFRIRGTIAVESINCMKGQAALIIIRKNKLFVPRFSSTNTKKCTSSSGIIFQMTLDPLRYASRSKEQSDSEARRFVFNELHDRIDSIWIISFSDRAGGIPSLSGSSQRGLLKSWGKLGLPEEEVIVLRILRILTSVAGFQARFGPICAFLYSFRAMNYIFLQARLADIAVVGARTSVSCLRSWEGEQYLTVCSSAPAGCSPFSSSGKRGRGINRAVSSHRTGLAPRSSLFNTSEREFERVRDNPMRIALSYVSVPLDNLGVNVGAGLEDTENLMLPESSGSVREYLSDPIRTERGFSSATSMDKRQWALEISGNSVYGSYGFRDSPYL
eukprot:Gb_07150 [translate_table: standard]